jgi:ubiquinone/menaquinone biosynthesis C-methylase UbiE
MPTKSFLSAEELHQGVPPNWYYQSLRVDPLQKIWHLRRFKEVGKLVERADKILDIGCADGMFSKVILDKAKAKKLIGLDVLKTSVAWANKHWKHTGKMEFLVGDANDLKKFESGSFDAVFALEVLEHVHRPLEALTEIKRVLKKGGYGVFLVPSDSLLFKVIWFFWLHFYPRGWVWRDTHIQTYRNNYLPKVCKKVGFLIEQDKKFNLGMLHVVKVRKY